MWGLSVVGLGAVVGPDYLHMRRRVFRLLEDGDQETCLFTLSHCCEQMGCIYAVTC